VALLPYIDQQVMYDNVALCIQYVGNSCSSCSAPTAAAPPAYPHASYTSVPPPTGTNWIPVGGYSATSTGTNTPVTYQCPSGLTINSGVLLDTASIHPIMYGQQGNPLAKGNYAACLGNNTLYLPTPTPPTAPVTVTGLDTNYPSGVWGPQDVAGAFAVADITRLSSTAPVKGTASVAGKWKVASKSGVPDALVKDGKSTTMAVAEVMAFDSQNDGRGAWVWPAMGASFFTAFTGPNSNTPDVIPACDASILNPSPPCNATAGGLITDYSAARSQHPGGVNVAMCDGSNHFVVDTIDINVWRAYSTRNGSQIGSTGMKETLPTAPD
jgi:prepilin-type processing-associated H-X9-DG protein